MNSNNNNHHRHHQDGSQALEARIHDFEALLRRERDEALRRRELSQERLRLTGGEVGAASKSLDDLLGKLRSLEDQTGYDATVEIRELKRGVENWTNRANFQHGELLSMREQLQRLKEKRAKENSKRERTIKKLRDILGPQREHTTVLLDEAASGVDDEDVDPSAADADATDAGADAGGEGTPAEKGGNGNNINKRRRLVLLEDELQCDIDNTLPEKWPRLVESKAETVAAATCKVGNENDALESVLEGYHRQFGFDDAGDDEGFDRQDGKDEEGTAPAPGSAAAAESAAGEDETGLPAAATAAAAAAARQEQEQATI